MKYKHYKIIEELDNMLVLNKTAGISMTPDRFDRDRINLIKLLEKKYQKVWRVHRLDKETSGVCVCALDAVTHRFLTEQFSSYAINKTYHALIRGELRDNAGIIENNLSSSPQNPKFMSVQRKGKLAITHWRVLVRYRNHSLVELKPHTGRTHQLRVHMASLGHPIVADPYYGDGEPLLLSNIKKKYRKNKDQKERPLLSRTALHAYALEIRTSSDELKAREFVAPYPKDLRASVSQLGRTVLDSN